MGVPGAVPSRRRYRLKTEPRRYGHTRCPHARRATEMWTSAIGTAIASVRGWSVCGGRRMASDSAQPRLFDPLQWQAPVSSGVGAERRTHFFWELAALEERKKG